MTGPRLSIVIPSHNRADLLRDCLSSVRRHAPPSTEVTAVDDASPGGAVSAVARELGAGCVRLAARSGFCVAANAGVRAALSRGAAACGGACHVGGVRA